MSKQSDYTTYPGKPAIEEMTTSEMLDEIEDYDICDVLSGARRETLVRDNQLGTQFMNCPEKHEELKNVYDKKMIENTQLSTDGEGSSQLPDTPETDANEWTAEVHDGAVMATYSHFAKKLERERNKARMIAENLRYGIGSAHNEFMSNPLPWENASGLPPAEGERGSK